MLYIYIKKKYKKRKKRKEKPSSGKYPLFTSSLVGGDQKMAFSLIC
jgi:hypothetical protein